MNAVHGLAVYFTCPLLVAFLLAAGPHTHGPFTSQPPLTIKALTSLHLMTLFSPPPELMLPVGDGSCSSGDITPRPRELFLTADESPLLGLLTPPLTPDKRAEPPVLAADPRQHRAEALPAELLIDIIYRNHPLDGDRYFYRHWISSTLAFRSVCRRWRNALDAYGRFWTRLVLFPRRSPESLAWQLQKTHGYPLQLDILMRRDWAGEEHLIAPEARLRLEVLLQRMIAFDDAAAKPPLPRCTVVRVIGTEDEWKGGLQYIFRLVPFTPALSGLHATCFGDSHAHTRAPFLRLSDSASLSLDSVKHLTLNNVHAGGTKAQILDMWDWRAFRSLETLDLGCPNLVGMESNRADGTPYHDVAVLRDILTSVASTLRVFRLALWKPRVNLSSDFPASPVVLPALERLSLVSISSTNMQILQGLLCMPALHTLVLQEPGISPELPLKAWCGSAVSLVLRVNFEVDWEDAVTHAFSDIISCFPQLEFLCIEIGKDVWSWDDYRHLCEALLDPRLCPALKVLRLGYQEGVSTATQPDDYGTQRSIDSAVPASQASAEDASITVRMSSSLLLALQPEAHLQSDLQLPLAPGSSQATDSNSQPLFASPSSQPSDLPPSDSQDSWAVTSSQAEPSSSQARLGNEFPRGCDWADSTGLMLIKERVREARGADLRIIVYPLPETRTHWPYH